MMLTIICSNLYSLLLQNMDLYITYSLWDALYGVLFVTTHNYILACPTPKYTTSKTLFLGVIRLLIVLLQ